MEHYDFITRTDNASLFNQIKFLVNCAQDCYQFDLTKRRKNLKELLDADEKVYENEFIAKIKSRVDDSIRERQESLLAMKQERTKEVEKFVAAKKIHQNMLNCIEIREELKRKDYSETQKCQLEQMDEKLMAIAREKKDDEFWLNAQRNIADDLDRKQRNENELKTALQGNQCRILAKQLEEQRHVHEMDTQYSMDQKNALTAKIKASTKKDRADAHAKKLAYSRDLKEALNTICKQKESLEQEAQTYEDVFHEETMRQVNKEMEEAVQKSKGVKESVLDYLAYVKKFKSFTAEQNKKREEICDDIRARFMCYKNHPSKGIIERKRLTAESTHKILLKQICEEQARRAKLEALEREHKLLDNRFARLELRDKYKQREQIKSDLDLQLKELDRLNVEKQKQFSEELNRAEGDQRYCQELLTRHITDGIDYLPPHPNWKLMVGNDDSCKRAGGGDFK